VHSSKLTLTYCFFIFQFVSLCRIHPVYTVSFSVSLFLFFFELQSFCLCSLLISLSANLLFCLFVLCSCIFICQTVFCAQFNVSLLFICPSVSLSVCTSCTRSLLSLYLLVCLYVSLSACLFVSVALPLCSALLRWTKSITKYWIFLYSNIFLIYSSFQHFNFFSLVVYCYFIHPHCNLPN